MIFCFYEPSSAAELPALNSPSTLSGATTTARFFGGASRHGTSDFSVSFQSHESIDITAEIQVEQNHIGVAGEIYIIVEYAGQYFMRISGGAYTNWDVRLDTLQATISTESLAANLSVPILNQTSLGEFDLAGAQLNFYVAYAVEGAPQELYFNGTPLKVDISDYDPLRITTQSTAYIDATVYDSGRDRSIPVAIYPTESASSSPVILFSHGLGGNRFTAVYLYRQWSARGYNVVSMQHAGSDEAILDVPLSQVLGSFVSAASLENSIARIEDVSAVLNQLELWNKDPQHELFNMLDLSKVGMSGHSFGAVTTQAVSGQTLFTISGETRDLRIKSAIALSPSIPSVGSPAAAFANVDIPWLLMTGTEDNAPVEGVGSDIDGRLAVFPALPEGNFFELVLFEGEHHAFTDRELNSTQNPRNPAHHPIIQGLSTAFWDATLRGDQSSLKWLRGEGAISILDPEDSWQFKQD
ncbi:MAG: alpha/beta hydrolase family protein [Pseudohongiellaceae bacterium]